MGPELKALLLRTNVEEPSDELVLKRQQSINKFSQEVTSLEPLLNLVRFTFSLQTDSGSLDNFRKYFIEFDPEFPDHGRIYELRILAYATILHLFQEISLSIASILPLVVINCFGHGLREKPRDMDLVNISDEVFQNHIMKMRSPTNAAPSTDSLKKQLNEIQASIKSADFSNPAETSRDLFQKLTSSVKSLSKNLDLTIDQVNKNANIGEEESRILWWAVSNYSVELDKAWANTTSLESCVAIGKELSDLVTILPGPVTYITIIDRILNNTKKKSNSSTLLTVVSAIPLKLKNTIVDQVSLFINDLTPIHYAILESLESDSKQKLTTKMNRFKINPSKRLANSSFAIQFYRERIYIKGILTQEIQNE